MGFFGSDFSGTTDIDSKWTYLTGDEPERVALTEAVARRYITPRLGNPWDADYGLDLRSFVSDSIDPAQAEPMIINEALKEQRVKDCTAEITVIQANDGDQWRIVITCTPLDGDAFDLTLSVTKVSVELLNATEVNT